MNCRTRLKYLQPFKKDLGLKVKGLSFRSCGFVFIPSCHTLTPAKAPVRRQAGMYELERLPKLHSLRSLVATLRL